MKGKTVLITGANRGIGRTTALDLADRGAKIAVFCRNAEQGRAVVAEVESRGAEAELFLADFRSMAQVRAAVEAFKKTNDRLHVLINNAGAVFEDRRLTEERVEQTFAVNHLAHFLVTVEVLDLLRASAPSRIINVTSESHRRGWMRWHDLHFKADYKPQRAYAQAKLSTLLFTCELARRLQGTGVTANCLHPGAASKGFGPPEGGWASWLDRIAKPFLGSTPEEDAKTGIYLATSPDVESVSGEYFIKCQRVRPSGYGRDDGLARRIWTTSEMLLGMRAADAA